MEIKIRKMTKGTIKEVVPFCILADKGKVGYNEGKERMLM